MMIESETEREKEAPRGGNQRTCSKGEDRT